MSNQAWVAIVFAITGLVALRAGAVMSSRSKSRDDNGDLSSAGGIATIGGIILLLVAVIAAVKTISG